MTVLVFGRNGQVARAFVSVFENGAYYAGREEADFTKPDGFQKLIDRVNPSAIINAVAYTQVDKAETEEALAYQVNAHAPAMLAQLAKERSIPLVHYSTDYVFDGSGDAPRKESAICAPLNVYGKSKRAGEEAIIAVSGKHLIFRTSWVFDATGKNFFTTMLRLGRERSALSVVADQIGAPSYAPHLAKATAVALEKAQAHAPFPSGIYHMCNAGETSWHGFASAIFADARRAGLSLAVADCHPIPSDAYPTPATRPLNSRLDCGKLRESFGITLPEWQEGVQAALASYLAA